MRLTKTELAVDLAWIVLSVWYIVASQHYPGAGRGVPMTVAVIALVVAVVQLSGHLFPRLRGFTHYRTERGDTEPAGAPAGAPTYPDARQGSGVAMAAPAVVTDIGEPAGQPAPRDPEGERLRLAVGVAWSIGLVVGVLVLGFIVALPVFFLAYFLVERRSWRLGLISAAVMWFVAWEVFDRLLSVSLPGGVLGF